MIMTVLIRVGERNGQILIEWKGLKDQKQCTYVP